MVDENIDLSLVGLFNILDNYYSGELYYADLRHNIENTAVYKI